jgi:hypothetical protein
MVASTATAGQEVGSKRMTVDAAILRDPQVVAIASVVGRPCIS